MPDRPEVAREVIEMMLVACRIGRSPIDGIGVFTREPIPAGTPVWRFEQPFDILVSEAELAAAPAVTKAFFRHFAYELATHPGHLALDGDDGRFMNHSDEPNVSLSLDGAAFAAKDIEAGEELTCDYRLITSRRLEMEPPRTEF